MTNDHVALVLIISLVVTVIFCAMIRDVVCALWHEQQVNKLIHTVQKRCEINKKISPNFFITHLYDVACSKIIFYNKGMLIWYCYFTLVQREK